MKLGVGQTALKTELFEDHIDHHVQQEQLSQEVSSSGRVVSMKAMVEWQGRIFRVQEKMNVFELSEIHNRLNCC